VQETTFSSHSKNVPYLTYTNCIVTALLKPRIFVIDIATPRTVNDLAPIAYLSSRMLSFIRDGIWWLSPLLYFEHGCGSFETTEFVLHNMSYNI